MIVGVKPIGRQRSPKPSLAGSNPVTPANPCMPNWCWERPVKPWPSGRRGSIPWRGTFCYDVIVTDTG